MELSVQYFRTFTVPIVLHYPIKCQCSIAQDEVVTEVIIWIAFFFIFIFTPTIPCGYGKCPQISNTKISDKMIYASSADQDQTQSMPIFWKE